MHKMFYTVRYYDGCGWAEVWFEDPEEAWRFAEINQVDEVEEHCIEDDEITVAERKVLMSHLNNNGHVVALA